MGQTIQMVGALIVLSAFVANQRMGLRSDSVPFLVANAVGTAILAGVAGVNRDLGFLLLEGVWAIVSTMSLIRVLRGPTPRSRTA